MAQASATAEPALKLDIDPQGIGVITFDFPGSKANTLGQAILSEWELLLDQLEKKTDLHGLVLHSGKPGMFIAGADLKELGSAPKDSPTVRYLIERGLKIIDRIEALPYPTVAAIDGVCLGGGLEFALGFDFRLAGAHPKAEVGFPEVKVGLIPGWGGTQRLTRLTGPSLAAEMICSGDAIPAAKAREYGIVFDVVPSDKLLDECRRVLDWARQSGAWQQERKKKQQPVPATAEQLEFAQAAARGQVQAKTKGQFPAPLVAVDAIFRGCTRPLADGLKIETELMIPLVGSDISRSLIAVFFMTQRLQKDPGVSDPTIKPKPVQRVGVIGAGIMGGGIAGAHIRRGVPVLLTDSNAGALQKGVANIAGVMQSRIAIGRMTQAELLKALTLLGTTGSMAAMSDRDVVIEAVVENEDAKVQLYKQVQTVLPAEAILASNTSTISITRMAKAVQRPENFAGMHFFNPVDRMQLVEVIRGEKTSDVTTATLVALAKQIGKTPIVVKDCPGFLVNRILFPYMNEAMALLEEGAEPRALDKAALAFGMPMGPVTLNDVVGLDTALYAGRVVNTAFADRAKNTTILDELVAAGRLGQKTGSGFYAYPKGPKGVDDPALAGFLQKARTSPARKLGTEEMTDRLFLPMLTEASRVLMEGIVREPADVDMGLILGIGFPAFRGGLLRWADTVGLPQIVEKLRTYEKLGPRFQPTEQILKLATGKKGFYS
ncbi:MAG: enoyl-CoA hydratase/isomerase family protein [Planctomycetia bacterium]|nr:enoyl-CoA hydratase/isomerase family protein [Planctomycetia bacterium]